MTEGAFREAIRGAFPDEPAVSGGGAPVLESFSSAGAAGATSVLCPAPSGIEAGDILVAYHYMDATETIVDPAGWTPFNGAANSGHSSRLYYKTADASDEVAVNYSWASTSSEDRAVVMARLSGATQPATEEELLGTTNGSADLVTTLTPSQANSIAITFGSHDDTANNWDKRPDDTGWTTIVEQTSRTGTSSGAVRGGFWNMDDVSDQQTATYSVDNIEEARYGMAMFAPTA